jgi:hypothetical protein
MMELTKIDFKNIFPSAFDDYFRVVEICHMLALIRLGRKDIHVCI